MHILYDHKRTVIFDPVHSKLNKGEGDEERGFCNEPSKEIGQALDLLVLPS